MKGHVIRKGTHVLFITGRAESTVGAWPAITLGAAVNEKVVSRGLAEVAAEPMGGLGRALGRRAFLSEDRDAVRRRCGRRWANQQRGLSGCRDLDVLTLTGRLNNDEVRCRAN